MMVNTQKDQMRIPAQPQKLIGGEELVKARLKHLNLTALPGSLYVGSNGMTHRTHNYLTHPAFRMGSSPPKP